MEGVRALLRAVGEDPEREGLRDTPKRVLKALREMTAGHSVNVEKLLSVGFSAGNYDALVAVTGIEFSSTCEHHLLPFTGEAAVAYLPSQRMDARFPEYRDSFPEYRVVGLSKLPRLVDAFAQRLQLQEQLAEQIASAMDEHLKPRGCAVYLRASHSCAKCRGVRKQNAIMHTTVLRGACKTEPMLRGETLAVLGVGK